MSEEENQSEFDNEVYVNKENSINRIRGDYDFPWIGLIREVIQNSVDGWGYNKDVGDLPEDAELNINFSVDTEDMTIHISDSAGGMPKDILKNNLLAIDNPSTAKAKGNGAGSYGRGFWVIVSTGRIANIETNHASGIYTSKVSTKGRYKTIEQIDEPDIGTDTLGTTYEIMNVREEDMRYLSDWDYIEQKMIYNFAPLFNDECINITYEIDGVEHTVDAPDLTELREKHALVDGEDIKPFTYQGERYQVKDFVMIDATEMEDDALWRGVTYFKGNEYLDYPFMKVDDYDTRGLPSMNDPVKMFGWCDASDVCRPNDDGETLENNAHDNIQLNRTGKATNVKPKVYEVHDEFFKNNYNTEEKTDLFDEIVTEMNSIMSNMTVFSDMSTPNGRGAGDGPTPDSSPSVNTPLSFFRCKADAYSLDIGEDITLGIEFNPQPDMEHEQYQLQNVQIVNTTEDEVVYNGPSPVFDLEPNTPENHILDIVSFDTAGRYVYSAETIKFESDNDAVVDKSQLTFIVGDVEEEKEEKDKDSTGSVEYISSITPSPSEDAKLRAFISPTDDGLVLNVNTEWPTFKKIYDKYRGDEFREAQKELYMEWGIEAMIRYWALDEIEELDNADVVEDIIMSFSKTLNDYDKMVVDNHE